MAIDYIMFILRQQEQVASNSENDCTAGTVHMKADDMSAGEPRTAACLSTEVVPVKLQKESKESKHHCVIVHNK